MSLVVAVFIISSVHYLLYADTNNLCTMCMETCNHEHDYFQCIHTKCTNVCADVESLSSTGGGSYHLCSIWCTDYINNHPYITKSDCIKGCRQTFGNTD